MTRMRPLTDEEFNALPDDPAAVAPAAGAPLSDDEFDALPDGPTEVEGRKLNMLGNGLTFGLLPRATAAIKSGSLSGPDYEAAKQEEWRKDDAYANANPVTAFALEAAGSIPTMLVPGLGATRIAQAVARGGPATTGLSRSGRLARAAGFGDEIGTAASESGALGLKAAALTGGLASREDTVGGRLGDAAIAAPIGYAGGRVGNAIGARLAGAGENVSDLARVGSNAELGALTALRRGFERDSVTTDAMRNVLTPGVGRAQVAPNAQRVIMDAYGNALTQGLDETAARAAARTTYAQYAAQALGPNQRPLAQTTYDGHVNRVLNSYTTANEIPLAVDEVARLAGGRGQNLQWTRRAAMASPGEGRENITRSVMDRQEDVIDTVRNRVTNTLGDPAFEDNFRRLNDTTRQASNRLYDTARANEQPFDLSSVFDEVQGTYAFRAGATKDAVDSAIKTMRGIPDPALGGNYNRHTLDTYIQARGELNDLIDASMVQKSANGPRENTKATAALMDLKTKMDAIVRRTNPEWSRANDITADGHAIKNAMLAGERMKLSAGDRNTRTSVNQMRDWQADVSRLSTAVRGGSATPEQQALLQVRQAQIEAMRLGFARPMHSLLSGAGDTHDVSKFFLKGGRRSQDGARQIVRTMMGDESDAFMGLIERAKIAHTTYKTHFNSQTTPLREAIDEQNQPGKVAGAMQALSYWANPSAMLRDLGESISNRLNEQRNTALLRRYGVTTENPAQFFNMLDEVDSLALARRGAFTNPGVNAYSAGGQASGAFGAAATQDRERK